MRVKFYFIFLCGMVTHFSDVWCHGHWNNHFEWEDASGKYWVARGIIWGAQENQQLTDGFGVLSCATYFSFPNKAAYDNDIPYTTASVHCFYTPYNGTRKYGDGTQTDATIVWVNIGYWIDGDGTKKSGIPDFANDTPPASGPVVDDVRYDLKANNNSYHPTRNRSSTIYMDRVSYYNPNYDTVTINSGSATIPYPSGQHGWKITLRKYLWLYGSTQYSCQCIELFGLQTFDIVLTEDITIYRTDGTTINFYKGNQAQFWINEDPTKIQNIGSVGKKAVNYKGQSGILLYLDGKIALSPQKNNTGAVIGVNGYATDLRSHLSL